MQAGGINLSVVLGWVLVKNELRRLIEWRYLDGAWLFSHLLYVFLAHFSPCVSRVVWY